MGMMVNVKLLLDTKIRTFGLSTPCCGLAKMVGCSCPRSSALQSAGAAHVVGKVPRERSVDHRRHQ
jgi:hypothetical protein